MDKLYMKGDLLKLETIKSEIIEGRFFAINSDKSKISLYDVKEGTDGVKSESVCHYYETEVHSIVKLQDSEAVKRLKISQKECEDIIKVSKKFSYINQVDCSFHEAIDALSKYQYIVLSTDGANMGRKCKMPFLVASSPKQIYIFDTQVMNHHAFDAGLKDLLENETPKKIIHDCRKISDCLKHKHNVKLTSVFDTQVGDLIITKNKTGTLSSKVKSLSDCLNIYLGLPNSIDEKLDIVQCTERPLSLKIKEQVAKNIAFMHRLAEMINDEMMMPFVRGVECYIENLRSLDDFKAWELCGKQNQIPKDFKSAIDY